MNEVYLFLVCFACICIHAQIFDEDDYLNDHHPFYLLDGEGDARHEKHQIPELIRQQSGTNMVLKCIGTPCHSHKHKLIWQYKASRLAKPINPVNKILPRYCSINVPNIPRVQCEAPDFKGIAVINDSFKDICLQDYHGKYVVLVFYPLDFTFVCPTELIAFDNKYDVFQKLNTEIIGISIDSHYSHLGWMNTDRKAGGVGKLKYPLLSDINKNISKNYSVLLEQEGIALRGLFIIDPKGIIRHMSINDLPIGRSVDETLRLIEALQFVEKHGEVCPANWQQGQKTIKPDPKGSKEYFETSNK